MDPTNIVAKNTSDLGGSKGQSVGQLLVPLCGLLIGITFYYYFGDE